MDVNLETFITGTNTGLLIDARVVAVYVAMRGVDTAAGFATGDRNAEGGAVLLLLALVLAGVLKGFDR